ncbi:unnamed protein product [Sphagnum troendelagicum]
MTSASLPTIHNLKVEDFKIVTKIFIVEIVLQGAFSFDDYFKRLVEGVLPELQQEDDNDHTAHQVGLVGSPLLAGGGIQNLGSIFKQAQFQLVDLCFQVDGRLEKLHEEVEFYDRKHERRASVLEEGIDSLYRSFNGLDARVSSVGQTAANIGEHLQNADSQRVTASQAINLIRYLMEFNARPGDLMRISPLFSDDDCVSDAAAIAQKLRSIVEDNMGSLGSGIMGAKTTSNAAVGLEVAITNLQDYCNELENRLLAQFDAASVKRDFVTMAESAKILSKFNRGMSAMQRYVASRPMFMDLKVMNKDALFVLGTKEEGGCKDIPELHKALSTVTVTVQDEARIIAAVFPSPSVVMAILVQRVLEQRVNTLLDKLLLKPSLANPPQLEDGGLQQYLCILAGAYERTKKLADELQALGCGDFNAQGLAESLFSSHMEDYIEYELASLGQLFKVKVAELKDMQLNLVAVSSGPHKKGSIMASYMQISDTAVQEFVKWNEKALGRCCTMLTLAKAGPLATNANLIFTCLLSEVSQYTTEGLERAMDALQEAATLRARFAIPSTSNRRVAVAAAAAGGAATIAGEKSVRVFMVAIQRATSNVAMVQQHFMNTVLRMLLPVDGAHSACCEEMAAAMANTERTALKGLQSCINAMIAELERLLVAEQRVTDFNPPEDPRTSPDHHPTKACTSVMNYLTRMLNVVSNSLEGFNKRAFLTELGNRMYKALLLHLQHFTLSASGGLRLKHDISEYADYIIRNFKAPEVEVKFRLLGTLVNVFVVAPESLPTLIDSSLGEAKEEAMRLIQQRVDYKVAKIAKLFTLS